jgi:hypothetical protein
MKGGAPLAMCREHRCSHAHVYGVPLLADGTLSLTLGSIILVREERGILHLNLWAISLKIELVMFDPHASDSS